jgi:hypothetical protein
MKSLLRELHSGLNTWPDSGSLTLSCGVVFKSWCCWELPAGGRGDGRWRCEATASSLAGELMGAVMPRVRYSGCRWGVVLARIEGFCGGGTRWGDGGGGVEVGLREEDGRMPSHARSRTSGVDGVGHVRSWRWGRRWPTRLWAPPIGRWARGFIIIINSCLSLCRCAHGCVYIKLVYNLVRYCRILKYFYTWIHTLISCSKSERWLTNSSIWVLLCG